jgi:hypothetical protein
MCDEPFPAVPLLPAEVVGHNLTAVTQGMLDVDLGRDLGATYTRVTVKPPFNGYGFSTNKLTVWYTNGYKTSQQNP